jgi:hypothetical protein
MSVFNPGQVSGITNEYLAQFRTIRRGQGGAVVLAQGRVIAGSVSRDPTNTAYVDTLQPGLVMGIVTATGKYAPSIIGLSTVAYTSGTTSLTVSPATAVEIVRRITNNSGTTFKIVGAPTVGGTVATTTVTFSAVNTTTGVITVTDIGANYVVGSFIMPTDGSEAPLAFIDDGSGIKVTDFLGNNLDVENPAVLVGGQIDTSQIINLPPAANTTQLAWLKGQLNSVNGSGFYFDDTYGA